MAFFETGGYPIGGARGVPLSAQQKARMAEGRTLRKTARAHFMQQDPNISVRGLKQELDSYMQQNGFNVAKQYQKKTNQEKVQNYVDRLAAGREYQARNPSQTYKPYDELTTRGKLKNKMFGHPATTRYAATPGFRQKMTEEQIMALLQSMEQQGFGIWDTLGHVASSAMQVAPHLLPLLL